MKILYISQYYPPETPAPAARASELAALWAAAGQDVMVLTGFPNHPTGKVHPQYRTKLWRLFTTDDSHGVRVRRTWLMPLPNRKSWQRMLNYGSFFVSAAVRGIFLPKPEVLIATSPQLLVGLAGCIVAKWQRVPFVFEVRDLWPESLEAVGAGSSNSVLVKILKRVAGLLYRNAAHIVVVTVPFKDHLQKHWGIPDKKISVIVNGVDHRTFFPQPKAQEVLREFGLEGKFVVGYFGTIGNAHGIETLVQAAQIVAAVDPRIVFFVVGEGADKEMLYEMIERNNLTNIRMFPGQLRHRMPAIIAASDVCLVLLKNAELFKTVIPTKMLEFMSCGRPVIAAVAGEAARVVENAGAGICVPPGDSTAVAQAIFSLAGDAIERQQLAENGRKFIVSSAAREGTARDYISLLEGLVKRSTDAAVEIVELKTNAGGSNH
jgi:glycosyltransferase involved in cell wall biosynthesis